MERVNGDLNLWHWGMEPLLYNVSYSFMYGMLVYKDLKSDTMGRSFLKLIWGGKFSQFQNFFDHSGGGTYLEVYSLQCLHLFLMIINDIVHKYQCWNWKCSDILCYSLLEELVKQNKEGKKLMSDAKNSSKKKGGWSMQIMYMYSW